MNPLINFPIARRVFGVDWGVVNWVTVMRADGTLWGMVKPRNNVNPMLLAEALVKTLPPRSYVVVERLRGVRKKLTKRPRYYLSFVKLQQALTTIAPRYRVTVLRVSPSRTSVTCPRCGFCSPNNRFKRVFRCARCRYRDDADRVGAWNLALKGLKILTRKTKEA